TTGTPFTDFVTGALDYNHLNVAGQVADPNSLFHTISKMIRVRKEHQAFGRGSMEWVDTDNPAIAVYKRTYQDETMLILNNLSDSTQSASLPKEDQTRYINMLSNTEDEI